MKLAKIALLLFIAILISACVESQSEFIGNWHHVGYDDSMTIVENGPNLIVKIQNGPTFPDVVKDGLLEVTVEGGHVLKFLHVKDTDKLVMGEEEFVRQRLP